MSEEKLLRRLAELDYKLLHFCKSSDIFPPTSFLCSQFLKPLRLWNITATFLLVLQLLLLLFQPRSSATLNISLTATINITPTSPSSAAPPISPPTINHVWLGSARLRKVYDWKIFLSNGQHFHWLFSKLVPRLNSFSLHILKDLFSKILLHM